LKPESTHCDTTPSLHPQHGAQIIILPFITRGAHSTDWRSAHSANRFYLEENESIFAENMLKQHAVKIYGEVEEKLDVFILSVLDGKE
jgi:hypothetical protein